MSVTPDGRSSLAPGPAAPRAPLAPVPPGQLGLVEAGLAIGILLLGVQLWLLTVALDLYLGGRGGEVWGLALISGLIFVGGLAMLRLLERRPRVHHLGEMPRTPG